MGTSSPTTSHVPHVGDWPITNLIGGAVILLVGSAGATIQLTTSEMWFSGQHTALTLAPHFGVLWQIFDFWNGTLSGMSLEGAEWAYVVQLIQLGCSIGLEWPKQGKVWDAIFVGFILFTIGLNCVADFVSCSGGFLQQLGFMVMTFIMSFGPAKYGIHYVVKGIRGFMGK